MSAQLAPPMPSSAVTTKPKPDMTRAPTIIAACCASTPEERKADPALADKLASDLYRIMIEWARRHEPTYLEADENWDFYLGRHYAYRSVALNARILNPPVPVGVIRMTWNYIARAVERQVSIILKDRPVIRCMAGADNVIDEAAGEAAENVVEWRQNSVELAAEPERVARMKAVSGFMWVHEEWDSSAGPNVPLMGPDGQPQIRTMDEATGLPLLQPEVVKGPQGAFARELLSHRQGVPDPSASHPFGGSFFFVRKRMSRFDLAKLRPDLKIEEFPPEGDEALKKVADLGRGSPTSSAAGAVSLTTQSADDLEVVVGYLPKCPDYPKGRRFLFTERHLLEEEDNPRYPTDEEIALGEPEPIQTEEPCWPVFPFVHLHRDQSPLGYSPVHACIQPNKAINSIGSSSLMHIGRAKGKWKVPTDLAEELTDETIQILKVPRRGFDPNTLGAIAPPPMSPENAMWWRENKDAILEFMGLNNPAVGQQDTAGDSGYKVRLQQQVADNDLSKVSQRDNAMWACVYRYDLLLFRRYADTKRQIEIIGDGKEYQFRALDRTAILPNTRVRCLNDSSVPRDPTQRMIYFMQFMQSGVMQLPPEQRAEMFDFLRLHDAPALLERKASDRMRARRQIQKIVEGKDPGQVSDMDDHLIQMEIIREFGLSVVFEAMVEKELTAAMKAIQAQPMMPGMPPPAPPVSPTYQRTMDLYAAHKQALMAQTQAMAPPPMEPESPPAQPMAA